jgi:UDP-N-acetylmuramyl pentapeptide phosphotransferase/UDP-N-acetylglucosamine-1-phosphate transferase
MINIIDYFFYLIILLVSFSLTYLVKSFAQKKALMDIPNERSSHTIPTPRGGGLAIAIVWFVALSYFFYTQSIEPQLYYALLSGALLCIISFADDIYSLKALPRFIIHALVAAFGLYSIGGAGDINLGFFIIPDSWILNFIAFIGIVWFINLFNFIDGIDGYAASETVFVSLGIYYFVGANYLLVLVMATLGFLFWNWDKAKIFMGDVGSTLLGFTLIILMIYFNKTHQFSLLNGLILSSVFWFDATYTLFKRFKNKEKLGEAHRKHAYQRMTQYGFSHQKTVLCAMGLNCLLFAIVIASNRYPNLILLFFVFAALLLWSVYKIVDKLKPFNNK